MYSVSSSTIVKTVFPLNLYAEQKYKDLKGSEKYEKAVGKAISVLNSKNINVSSDELDMLVESAVLSLTNVVKEKND